MIQVEHLPHYLFTKIIFPFICLISNHKIRSQGVERRFWRRGIEPSAPSHRQVRQLLGRLRQFGHRLKR